MKKHPQAHIPFQAFTVGAGNPLLLIAGPCVVENREMIFRTAEECQKIAWKCGLPFIFKSSYKKANRTSGKTFISIGMEKALHILAEAKKEFGIPILTDVHSETEVEAAADIADVLQIPAFLCRQTELLEAAARTDRAVNIKKGQFVAPEDMQYAAEKVTKLGNHKVMLTERGSSFGYHNLVVDMRSLKIMRDLGYPVILDVTHSVQLPSGGASQSGGQPEFIFPIARAGVAVGIDGVFIETHPDPRKALSDSASQLKLDLFETLVKQIVTIDRIVKEDLAI